MRRCLSMIRLALPLEPLLRPPPMWGLLISLTVRAIELRFAARQHSELEEKVLLCSRWELGAWLEVPQCSWPQPLVHKPKSISKSFMHLKCAYLSFFFIPCEKLDKSFFFYVRFLIKKKKLELVESGWIDDAKDFFLKHCADIVAPEMLWR